MSCVVTLNGIDYKVYTECETDVKGNLAHKIMAYDAKHDLPYRGYMFLYRDDLFTLADLYEYINKQIKLNNITLEIMSDNLQFLTFKVKYGVVCGEPLVYTLELLCKKNVVEVMAKYEGRNIEKQTENPPQINKQTEISQQTGNPQYTELQQLREENTKLKQKLDDLKKLMEKARENVRERTI